MSTHRVPATPAQNTAAPTQVEGAAQARHVPHRWRNLAVLTGVTVVDNTEAGLSTTLFPTIAAALKLQSSHLGLLAALGKLVAVPAGPAWAWLAGKIGRRKALVATTFVGGAFGIAAGFSQDFVQLLIFNTLMSAAIIGGSPVTVEGVFPITPAAWDQFIAVLNAMKPGLVASADDADE